MQYSQQLATMTTGKSHSRRILAIRNRYVFLFDVLALLFIPALALTLRVEGVDWWPRLGRGLILFSGVALLVKLPIFYYAGLYCRYWVYASVNELFTVLYATGLSTILLAALTLGTHSLLVSYELAVARTIPLLDGMLTLLAVGGSRVSLRGLYHWRRQYQGWIGHTLTLVVGAGEAGQIVVREMRANPESGMEPMGFVDDDEAKIGTHIQGLPVMGSTADIAKLVNAYPIQRIVVAIPSAPLGRQKEILALCHQLDITPQVVPGVYELLAGYKIINRVPTLNTNQLLAREPIVTEQAEVAELLAGKTILITGAGGSIGSEICRQIAHLKPRELILLGHGENSIFEVALDLRLAFQELSLHQEITDIRNRRRINALVETYRPALIFHAAAHKHVSYMQENVEEAITNNILGTRNVLLAAEKYGVERFVLISTDKAINPTSIMGVTKRIAELLVMAIAHRSAYAYMGVRFGNVLGSRGSVLPIFQRQIAAGGPVTITDAAMARYFMTIPEAVQLVLQASVLGQGGEMFVLDMGQPMRILDLASKVVQLSGLELGRDIELTFTGMKPGEKLHEDLFLENEYYQPTRNKKIFMATDENTKDAETMAAALEKLNALVKQGNMQAALAHMQKILSGTSDTEFIPSSRENRTIV